MKRHYLYALFCFLLMNTSAWAYDFKVGDLYYTILNDTLAPYSVEVASSSSRTADTTLISAIIPASVVYNNTTYEVVGIGNKAFYQCMKLSVVSIPSSVRCIGEYAFYNCLSLTNLTIPEGIVSIQEDAFSSCTGLTSISLPNSLKKIESYVFSGCTQMTSIVIPDGVEEIEHHAFYDCTNLCSVTLPNNITSIGDYTFYKCHSLSSIEIPSTTTEIGDWAFGLCPSLTSVSIPQTVTSIGNYAFQDVTNIMYSGTATGAPWGAKSVNGFVDGLLVYENANKQKLLGCSAAADTAIIIPNSVTEIAERAFYRCSKLPSVTIPNGVTGIKNRTFYLCTALSSIAFPNSVTHIEEQAFYGCDNLTNITVPTNLSIIGEKAFYRCKKLNTLILPNTVTEVDTSAFYECTNLQSVQLSNSMTRITYSCFSGCTNLQSITIPNSITSIEAYAFSSCKNLAGITIPSTVTTIESDAFYGITFINYNGTATGAPWGARFVNGYIDGLLVYENASRQKLLGCLSTETDVAIVIPNTVTEIASGAFSWCKNIPSIAIPNSVKTIGVRAFYGCESLLSITIPNSVKTIGGSAFSHCTSLSKITIPSNVDSIGGSILQKCTNLTSVVVEKGNTTYDSRDNCNAIIETASNTLISGCATTTIPNSITKIGSNAFNSQIRLKSICIPEGVTEIENGAFSSCDSLINVKLPNSLLIIGENAFRFNRIIPSITLPPSVDSIGAWAIYMSTTAMYSLPTTPPKIKHPYQSSSGDVYVLNQVYEDYQNSDWGTQTKLHAGTVSKTLVTKQSEQANFSSLSADIKVCPISSRTVTQFGYLFRDSVFWLDIPADSIVHIELSDLAPETVYNITFMQMSDSILQYSTWKKSPALYQQTLSFSTTETPPGGTYIQSSKTTQSTIAVTYEGYNIAGDVLEHGLEYKTENEEVFHTLASKKSNLDLQWTDTIKGRLPNTNYVVRAYIVLEDSTAYSEEIVCQTKDIAMPCVVTNSTQATISVSADFQLGDMAVFTYPTIGEYKGILLGASDYRIFYDSVRTFDTIIRDLQPNTEYTVKPFVVAVEITYNGEEKTGELTYIYGEEQTIRTKGISISLSVNNNSVTQTKSTLSVRYSVGDANIINPMIVLQKGDNNYDKTYYYLDIPEGSGTIDTTLAGLIPNTQYKAWVSWNNDDKKSSTYSFTTRPIVVNNPTIAQYGQTYVQLESNCDYGDATLLKNVIQLGTNSYADTTIEVTNNVVKVNNLEHNKKYYYRNVIETIEAGTIQSEWASFYTQEITLRTGEADGISNTSAYLHGTVDCDQESYTEVGFEWKRSDAPSTVNPQRLLVTDRTDENLIFRLEGLSPDRYYDFRTFCMYQGKTYYGAWVGFLTADKEVVIAPTVETLGATANEKGVEMSGKVVSGTEPILQQGFESWIKGSTTVATTVAEGKTMIAYIPEPWAYETYQYRAYAKTASGTTYGETLEVTTGYIEREITDVEVTPSTNSAEVTWAAIEVADYYMLTLFRDKEMSDTLAIYEVSPSGKVKQVRKPMAKTETITCTIEDLYQNTTYYFAVQAYNDEDQMIAEEIGSFTTLKEEMGVQDTEVMPDTRAQKVLRNGQVLIIRNGKVYTMMGKEVFE